MGGPGGKRKNKKQYYMANKKAKRQSVLQEGMRGFLLTCNNREKEAVREAYNLLNEYKEKIVGPPTDSSAQDESDDSGQDSDGDIEAALEKEKADLNKERSKKPSEREFQVVDSGARNCIFIKTSLDCPEKLMEEIISDLEETKKLKSRYILRMIPVSVTCKTAEQNIELGLTKAIENVFLEGSTTSYSINFKTRNNGQVKRDDVIQLATRLIRSRPGETTVDLKSPDITVIVDVIRAVVCISVVRNFFQRRKYNLAELGKPDQDLQDKEVLTKDGDAEASKEINTKDEDAEASKEGVTKDEDTEASNNSTDKNGIDTEACNKDTCNLNNGDSKDSLSETKESSVESGENEDTTK